MCTLFLFINQFKNIPLAIISNRDEIKTRQTKMIQGWDNSLSNYGNDIISPRDEVKKGTWFAAQAKIDGKWAILTNIREPLALNNELQSRGEIIVNFLKSNVSAKEYLNILIKTSDKYNYFNIIFSDQDYIYYFHSKNKSYELLHKKNDASKKIFGLSNDVLNCDWPKVKFNKEKFEKFIINNKNLNSDDYWNYFKREMQNNMTYELSKLPKTGIPIDKEILYSSLFIKSNSYGTRSTIFFGIESNRSLFFYEQSYGVNSLVENSKNIVIRFHEIDESFF